MDFMVTIFTFKPFNFTYKIIPNFIKLMSFGVCIRSDIILTINNVRGSSYLKHVYMNLHFIFGRKKKEHYL